MQGWIIFGEALSSTLSQYFTWVKAESENLDSALMPG